MKKSVSHGKLLGRIKAPPSKSVMQRAVAAALLNREKVDIYNPSFCEDALASLRVVKGLGAAVNFSDQTVTISGIPQPENTVLDCGEAGLCIRMFLPVVALFKAQVTLTGSGSLTSRPMDMVTEPLTDLGVRVNTRNGYLPITVQGPMAGGEILVDCSLSSQFLTGLLLALPLAKNNSLIQTQGLVSRPYVDLTLDLLRKFKVDVENPEPGIFKIKGGQQYHGDRFTVEGDWSGAAFLLVGGAIAGKVTVTGLDPDSPQGDKRIITVLKNCGAGVDISRSGITVVKQPLKGFTFNARECPDLFPPLIALAINCRGTSEIYGADRLIHKESNRALVLTKEFSAVGADLEISGDTIRVRGRQVAGGTINSHNDHRIAMAGAIAGLNSSTGVTVLNSECVAKSYPDFFNDLEKLGGNINE